VPMVRMVVVQPDKLANVRVYKFEGVEMHLPQNVVYVRWSKSVVYETPYSVTGTIQHTGSKQEPKGTHMIDLLERRKL